MMVPDASAAINSTFGIQLVIFCESVVQKPFSFHALLPAHGSAKVLNPTQSDDWDRFDGT